MSSGHHRTPRELLSLLVGGIRREWRAVRLSRAPWVTGIDVDGNTLRLAQVQVKDDQYELRGVDTVELLDSETGKISEQARRTLKKWGVGRGRIVTILPRDQLTVKRVRLPSHDPGELRRMACFEAARHLPRAPEELLADVELIATHEDGHSDVWLVAATQKQVEQHLSLFDELGLEPDKIEVSTTAMSRAAHGEAERSLTLCHVSGRRADILIQVGEETSYSRGIDLSLLNGDEESLVREIARSFQQGRQSHPEQPPRPLCYLTGDGFTQGLESRLAQWVSVEQHRFPSSFSTNGAKEDLSPYVPAIGAALDPGGGINLLPATLVRRRALREQLRSGFWVALLSIALVALSLALSDRYLGSAGNALDEVRQEVQRLRPEVQDLRLIQDQSQAIARHLNPQTDALEIYRELFRIAPRGISLSHMSLGRGRVVLKGQVQEFSPIWRFVEAMSGSPLFTNVRTQFATRRSGEADSVIDFSLEAELNEEEKP